MGQVRQLMGSQPPTSPDQKKAALEQVLTQDGLSATQISSLESQMKAISPVRLEIGGNPLGNPLGNSLDGPNFQLKTDMSTLRQDLTSAGIDMNSVIQSTIQQQQQAGQTDPNTIGQAVNTALQNAINQVTDPTVKQKLTTDLTNVQNDFQKAGQQPFARMGHRGGHRPGGAASIENDPEYVSLLSQAQALGITDIPQPGSNAIEELQAVIDAFQQGSGQTTTTTSTTATTGS
jgi:hypothetical protein